MLMLSCPDCRRPYEGAAANAPCPACGDRTDRTARPADTAGGIDPTLVGPPGDDVAALLAPPQAPDEIGRLGGYRVLRQIGAGGMGVVLLVEDPALQRRLALKVLRPEAARAPHARERFLREARAAAALTHDHVIPIYHVGEERGTPFLVMPFLEGEPLDARLARQKTLPVAEALRVAREVAEGLAAAHAKGLIHRDVKPANVWLEGLAGRVRLLDFGLARPAAAADGLTRQGELLGTPAYMAPEQAAGGRVDHRADLFSLGVLLYEMLTGRRPFRGPDVMAVLSALATHEPPPPRTVNDRVPPGASDLAARLLAKRPEDRPDAARAVADRLRALENEAAPPPAPPRRRRLRLAAVALLAAGVVTAGAVALWPEGRTQGPPAAEIDGGPLVLTGHDNAVHDVAFSPDGTRVLSGSEDFTARVWGAADGRAAFVLKGHAGPVRGVAFGGLGRWLATGGYDRSVRIWDAVAGLEERTLEDHPGQVTCVALHCETDRLAAGSFPGAVVVWALTEGEELHRLKGPFRKVTGVAFDRGGARLAASFDGGAERHGVALWDVHTGSELGVLTGPTRPLLGVCWSPDGKRVAAAGEDGGVWVWPAAGGAAARLEGHEGKAFAVAWSPDGARLASGGAEGTVRLWGADGRAEGVLRGHAGSVYGVAWAPDGRRLASGGHDRTVRVWDVGR